MKPTSNKSEGARNGKIRLLEGIISIGSGFGLAFYHSAIMYDLMDRAGLYVTRSPTSNVYPQGGLNYSLAAALGTSALLFCGMHIGRKLGRFIGEKFNGH